MTSQVNSICSAKRAEQIRQMTESTRSQKIDSIREAQDKKRIQVNFRHKRIIRTFLPNGTKVYRKNEGISTKLEPRWIEPYSIIDHDERGNYFVKDVSEQSTHNKYPLEKLGIESSSDTQSSREVKKIIGDKRENNKI